MNQFFIDSSAINNGKITITGSDVKHIEGVLRLRIGEEIQAVNPDDGLTYFCSIENLEKDAVICLIQDVQSKSNELPVNITLFQGLPKGDKLEFVIQKAVELGATQIVPVSMKRSVMKLDPKKADNKLKRWNSISESAASQSKRGIIPEVLPVVSFDKALESASDMDAILLPYELAESMSETRNVMEDLKKQIAQIIQAGERIPTIGIFVGPEGGFELSEIEKAKTCGAKIITLGRRILRTETAPLAILSWLTYLMEE